MSTADIIDIVVLGIIGASGLFGFWRGFIREIFVLIAWVAAGVVALQLTDFLAGFLLDALPEEYRYELIASLVTFLGLFIVTLFLLSYIGSRLSDAITDRGVTAVNRSIGAAYGLVRGVVLVGAMMLVLQGVTIAQRGQIPDDLPEAVRTAQTFQIADFTATLLKDIGNAAGAAGLIETYLEPGDAPPADTTDDPLDPAGPLQVAPPDGATGTGGETGYDRDAQSELDRISGAINREEQIDGGDGQIPTTVIPGDGGVRTSPVTSPTPQGVPRPPERPTEP